MDLPWTAIANEVLFDLRSKRICLNKAFSAHCSNLQKIDRVRGVFRGGYWGSAALWTLSPPPGQIPEYAPGPSIWEGDAESGTINDSHTF